MVGFYSYRNPALLAKITSHGRRRLRRSSHWGIGAGWYEHEYRTYGYDFPAPQHGIGRLGETVEIVKRMWTQPTVTFHGEHFDVDRAHRDPKPLQRPHPPI